MKALIIGGAGFVGKYLIEYLCSQINIDVYSTKLPAREVIAQSILNNKVFDLDILNKKQVKEVIEFIKPDFIYNLAAQSSVPLSWDNPALTFNINVVGTINILESVKELSIQPRILLIGSSEEYGAINLEDLPLKESHIIEPSNPYAISKFSQEIVARMYVHSYNFDIVLVRAFNHIGPGQKPVFVISDFAKQIAEIEAGFHEPVIFVGNLDVKRDFTDVRDIVRGYHSLVRYGNSGEVYNIGSGKSIGIKQILDLMIKVSNCNIFIKVDQSKFRPTDIPELRADITKIKEQTDWIPRIEIEDSIIDVINYWRDIIKRTNV